MALPLNSHEMTTSWNQAVAIRSPREANCTLPFFHPSTFRLLKSQQWRSTKNSQKHLIVTLPKRVKFFLYDNAAGSRNGFWYIIYPWTRTPSLLNNIYNNWISIILISFNLTEVFVSTVGFQFILISFNGILYHIISIKQSFIVIDVNDLYNKSLFQLRVVICKWFTASQKYIYIYVSHMDINKYIYINMMWYPTPGRIFQVFRLADQRIPSRFDRLATQGTQVFQLRGMAWHAWWQGGGCFRCLGGWVLPDGESAWWWYLLYTYMYMYQHLQRGAKWFLKGVTSPSLRV